MLTRKPESLREGVHKKKDDVIYLNKRKARIDHLKQNNLFGFFFFFSLRAYWAFKGYFPDQADALLATLDYSYKKMLYGEASLSGSNQSLNQGSLTRQSSASGRSRVPVTSSHGKHLHKKLFSF